MSSETTVVKQAVRDALRTVHDQFGAGRVTSQPDGQGGLWIRIEGLELGSTYVQHETFLVAQLQFSLPAADVYPLFVRPDLARVDGLPLGEGFSSTRTTAPGAEQPIAAVQVSRRTRGGQFRSQTAAMKIEKVMAWIRTR